MKKIISIIIIGLFITLEAMAVEEVGFEIIKKNDVYEIRKYSDRLVIETATSNQNSGFRKLFNYISGNNQTKEKINMTAPVTQVKKNEGMTMQFYLPSKFNLDSAPTPSNSEVKLLSVKGGFYAVIKYSGRSSDKNFIKHKYILEEQLKKNNVLILGPPIKASYSSPFTLPMLKRNEVMFEIDIKTAT